MASMRSNGFKITKAKAKQGSENIMKQLEMGKTGEASKRLKLNWH